MEDPSKEPRPEAKLKNLPQEELDFLWSLRYTEEGKLKKKLAAIQTEIPLRYGFTVAKSVLSEFYKWLRLRRQWQEDVALAETAKTEWLAEHPNASSADLLEAGQIMFTAQSMRRQDHKSFVQLLRAITARENAAANREKATAAKLTKIEAGLEALLVEIQGNPRALAKFEELKAEVSKR